MGKKQSRFSGEPDYGGGHGVRAPEMGLADLVRIIRRRFNVILGVTLVLTSIIMLATFQLEKKYSSTAQLLISAPEQTLVELQAFDTSVSSSSASIDSQISILQSRDLAGRVVDALDLMQDRDFNTSLAPDNGTGAKDAGLASLQALALTLQPLWEAAREASLTFARTRFEKLTNGAGLETARLEKTVPNAPDAAREPSSAPVQAPTPLTDAQKRILVIDHLLSALDVRRHEMSYVILVTATTSSPEKSALVANAVSDAYLEHQLAWRQDAVRQTDKWLGGQLDALGQKLFLSEQAVETYRAENGLLDSAGVTLNEQQRSEVNAQLIAAKADLAELDARHRRVKSLKKSGGNLDVTAKVMSSGVIIALKEQRAEINRKLAEMSNRYGYKHPKMINAQAELRGLEAQIKAEIDRNIGSLENEVLVARSRVKSIEQSLLDLHEGGADNERSKVVLNGLIREADANRQVFESLLESSKKSTILAGTDPIETGTRKISEASAPLTASFPKPKLIGGLGLVVSAFLGLSLAFVLESFDAGFKTPQQLEDHLGLANLAVVPNLVKSQRRVRYRTRTLWDYILLRPMSVFSEGFRSMRSALKMSDIDQPPKLIAITSSVPEEGKTTTTYCLAVQAASAGLKTLVVDADFRRGALTSQLGKSDRMGLVDVFSGTARLSDIILSDVNRTGLHFMPCGARSGMVSDILNSKRFSDFLAALKSEYDLVLFDTAPTLLVVDTPILASKVDKTVLLVAWNKTPRALVESACKRLQDFNVDIAGTALTLMDIKEQNKYYGDTGYGYGKDADKYYTN